MEAKVFWFLASLASPPTYESHHGWRKLEALLPGEQRVPEGLAPEQRWWGWRGHEVHLDVWEPAVRGKGTVVLVHGGGGNGRLLGVFAPPLVAEGFRVVAPDLPGFGLTRVPRGAAPRWETWVDLVVDLTREWEALGLYGMSLGGSVAYEAAHRCDSVEAVAVTTLLDLDDRSTLKAIAKNPGAVPLLNGPIGGLLAGVRTRVRWVAPLDKMSSRSDINAILRDDPLVGKSKVPLGFFRSIGRAERPPPVRSFALLVAHPTDDVWTTPTMSRARFDQHPGAKTWVDLDHAHHFVTEHPGRAQLDAAVVAHMNAWGVPGGHD